MGAVAYIYFEDTTYQIQYFTCTYGPIDEQDFEAVTSSSFVSLLAVYVHICADQSLTVTIEFTTVYNDHYSFYIDWIYKTKYVT